MTDHPYQKPPPPPAPPPPPCPEPCSTAPPWGPPSINPDCCPKDRDCCGEAKGPCSWEEVVDPCVRASSGECGIPWTKLTCKCTSSNEKCNCEEWGCGCDSDGGCVPCKPCEGLIPEDKPEDGECEDLPREGCDADALRLQLEANKKCISAQKAEMAKIDAQIKARVKRDEELGKLIGEFDGIVEKYRTERYKLTCREDCLDGFHRDVTKALAAEFPAECLEALEKAINAELCAIEKAKCCQKNLEWKLAKDTCLIAEQKDAEKAWKNAEEAFGQIKELAKWIGDRFTDLEKVKDVIAAALNDKDPLKHRYAFYLFYWKFVPVYCKRFKVAICCKADEGCKDGTSQPVHIGCEPGDWHPSQISPEDLTRLICCAWDYVRSQKEEFQKATEAVEAASRNLEIVKTKVKDDGTTLEDRIRRQIEKVVCAPGPASSRW